MDFLDRLRDKAAVQKAERFFPAIAFLGGFSWDSWTIGSKVYGTDLVFLSFYYLLALVSIYFIASRHVAVVEDCSASCTETREENPNFFSRIFRREWPASWIERLTWVVQFCFGNLYSALVICYFKSSGSIAAFIIVLILAALLVGNEFLKAKYEDFGVCLAFFCLLGTMFFNFLIPHLVHGMGTFWFFFSTLLSAAICYLLWLKFSREFSRNRHLLIAPVVVSVALSIAYLVNWIPPVPLVLKHQIVCKNFDVETYSCDADKLDFWQQVGLRTASIHKEEDEEIYFISSVYGPAELKAPIEFRWYYMEPSTNKFKLTDKISSSRMVIRGGRDMGYRSFSRKKNTPIGIYRVETAYKDGAVIGSQTFRVVEGLPKHGFVRDSLR